MSVAIRTQTPVILDLPPGGSCRGPIQSIAALFTHQQPLQQRWLLGVAQGALFVLRQAILSRGKGCWADHGRHRDLNPLTTLLFPTAAAAPRVTSFLPQRPCHPLPRADLGLAKTGAALLGGIAKHSPDRGTFPKAPARSRRNPLFIQPPGNSADTQKLLRIPGEDLSNHFGGRFH